MPPDDDFNQEFQRNGMNGPYAAGTSVIEGTTTQETQFSRVYTEGITKPDRAWTTTPDQIEGLSPEQIQDKLALPYEPTHVVDVHVPPGTQNQIGEAGPNYGGDGGGFQTQLLDRLPSSEFTNPRPIAQ